MKGTSLETAETFYKKQAASMQDKEEVVLDTGEVLHRIATREHRLEGQPVACWAAALMTDARDDARLTVDSYVDENGDPQTGARVYENAGRWVVDCPFCRSAQVASETDHRYLCADADCLNGAVDGAYIRTLWPE